MNKILKNNSGIILLTVIMLTIVLSIVAISIMSIHISHKRSSKSIVRSIKAEQIALGAFMQYQQMRNEGCTNPTCGVPGDCSTCAIVNEVTLDGQNYRISIDDTGVGEGPYDTTKVIVDVSF